MSYIRTADRLQRTARWIENSPGGINYLKEVIIDDKLGICAELEKQMEELVASYFCEWTETLKRPELHEHFGQFGNMEDQVETVEVIHEIRTATTNELAAGSANFKGHRWSSLSWEPITKEDYFGYGPPDVSSANVKPGDTQLANFKIKGKYYVTQQMCPHKRAFVLSDDLVGDNDMGKY
ncbi:hypothetical protein VTO42DRAFT_5609 [Malbranchea cinnamomea]